MTDKSFIDTNIFVCAVTETENNKNKRNTALDLIQTETNVVISTQVLNEFYNVLLRYKISDNQIIEYLTEIIRNTYVANQSVKTLKSAWGIKTKYNFSLWDSLIIASALQNNCTILYTEDMQHNQLIEDTLNIVNPFK